MDINICIYIIRVCSSLCHGFINVDRRNPLPPGKMFLFDVTRIRSRASKRRKKEDPRAVV